MKKSEKIFVAAVLLVFGSLGLASLAVAEKAAGKKRVVLDSIQKKQPPVSFPHVKHAKELGVKCTDCHHKAKKGTKAKACRKCHIDETEGKRVDLKKAYHKMCKGCHKVKKKEGKEKAPTRCKECHPKK